MYSCDWCKRKVKLPFVSPVDPLGPLLADADLGTITLNDQLPRGRGRKLQGWIMRAVTICQGRSHSSAFVWLDLSSLHNSIQSSSCWQQLSGSSQRNTPPPPTHSLQLLWMEKCWRTAQDRRGRKWSANEKSGDLMAVYSARHLPHVRRWTCVTDIRRADDENKRCTFTLDTLRYSTSPSINLSS